MAQSKIVVWGLGRENHAYLEYLERTAWDGHIMLFDDRDKPPDFGKPASDLPFSVEKVSDVAEALSRVDLLVRSPGVSPYKAEIRSFIERGGRVTTPTSLAVEALRHQGVKIVGVTGTNGKSSTCTMLGCIFEAADRPCLVAGNIGEPLINHVSKASSLTNCVVVLELSSYQIFDLEVPPSHVIFLNLFVDHVEWHSTAENYKRDKLSILQLPGIVNAIVHPDIYAKLESDRAHISSFKIPTERDYVEQCLKIDEMLIDLSGTVTAASEHMFHNASAAVMMAGIMGLSKDAIEKGLRSFKGLAHRLQLIEQIGGISFIDDSISTTPESVLAALNSFGGRRIHLILGGYDRGLDYKELLAALSNFDLGTLILMGDVGKRLGETREVKKLAASSVVTKKTKNLTCALDDLDLRQGDLILLSPGASSFDSYRDYIHRGEAFSLEVKRTVRNFKLV